MIVLYRSPFDGSIKGLDQQAYQKAVGDKRDWDKAMSCIAGLDTAVWVFKTRQAAEAFTKVNWIS